MEGFLEFIVYSFLNLYTRDYTLNGEILGIFISIFCSFIAVVFVPFALIWAILTKDERKIIEKDFVEKYGALFEYINTEKKMARLYNLIYILKRSAFLVICFLLNKSQS